MAGIEKVCEYSGDYPGHLMYGYKRNQLQIMPEYRKLFRGANYTLIVKFEALHWCMDGYSHMYEQDEWKDYEPPFVSENEFISWKKSKGYQLKKEYKYTLKVADPALKGGVNGEYVNWTKDLPTMKRKLKRLLRCRILNIQID